MQVVNELVNVSRLNMARVHISNLLCVATYVMGSNTSENVSLVLFVSLSLVRSDNQKPDEASLLNVWDPIKI